MTNSNSNSGTSSTSNNDNSDSAVAGGPADQVDSSPEKPTDQWVTGDEPMTGPQASYLSTLAREAGEEAPTDLTKAEASDTIERLQQATGRGADADTSR